MILARNTVLLVVDGSRMMILRNQGDTVTPKLTVVEQHQIVNPSNRNLLADAQGVGFSSAGAGRDSYEGVDHHRRNEELFIAEAEERLASVLSGNKDKAVVVAPPAALGVLRKSYAPALRERIIAEVPKDLTNHTIDEIARLIDAE